MQETLERDGYQTKATEYTLWGAKPSEFPPYDSMFLLRAFRKPCFFY